jgi:hypothetical protein
MIIDDYICKCGHTTEFNKEYGKDFPKTIPCEKCGGDARRRYQSKKIIVPQEMKSTFEQK